MSGDLAQKVTAAQAAVETAAALLAEHAEGLATLVALERNRYPAPWEPPASMRHATDELALLFPLPPEAAVGITCRAAAAFLIARDEDTHFKPLASQPGAAPWRDEIRRLVREA